MAIGDGITIVAVGSDSPVEGLIVCGTAMTLIYARYRLLRIGVPLNGTVVGECEKIYRDQLFRKHTSYRPEIEYIDPKTGSTRLFTPRMWNGPRLRTGSKVELRYRRRTNRVVATEAFPIRLMQLFAILATISSAMVLLDL